MNFLFRQGNWSGGCVAVWCDKVNRAMAIFARWPAILRALLAKARHE
jgi:hypothetical protein